ncbi:MAG: hypothetical protein FD141_529 [Fusobacteria bacterium]|nr:MAG: hypothetical protein FD141_529 [Fusobacteriota bacterium]KAF0228806.1 MAG: hypothetical protein FD182_1062 [Fusobacteriota bacterium]
MSFINDMIGVTIELDQKEMEERITKFLLDNEKLIKGYQIVRDVMILTDKRIIIVDYLGLRGKKIEYQMIPYHKINRLYIETPGNLDTDYTLKIFISGSLEPIEKQIKSDVDIYELNRIIFSYMLTK